MNASFSSGQGVDVLDQSLRRRRSGRRSARSSASAFALAKASVRARGSPRAPTFAAAVDGRSDEVRSGLASEPRKFRSANTVRSQASGSPKTVPTHEPTSVFVDRRPSAPAARSASAMYSFPAPAGPTIVGPTKRMV